MLTWRMLCFPTLRMPPMTCPYADHNACPVLKIDQLANSLVVSSFCPICSSEDRKTLYHRLVCDTVNSTARQGVLLIILVVWAVFTGAAISAETVDLYIVYLCIKYIRPIVVLPMVSLFIILFAMMHLHYRIRDAILQCVQFLLILANDGAASFCTYTFTHLREMSSDNRNLQATDQNTIIAEEAKAFQPEDVKTMTDFTLAACVRCYFNTS
ncbi:hypothetical protein PRIPAC_93700 [Pristionchus pacificus]|uniref:Uncharacterized protein n=1 Tax=Pristionchus pacificus TaxID=54126 RepID=A0A2A6BBP0_PRIPA|nr:hypothetical protein PRIPAC_93700 [Pristionchus pacificus]|eukprot:PDM63298.1 hypothetical protein PRIPAC_50513 [Pristionchus pacificus]